MNAPRCSILLAAAVAASASVIGAAQSAAPTPAASVHSTLFREIAHRENPVVVSITTRSRVPGVREDDAERLRFLHLDGPERSGHLHLATGSGFVIDAAGDIMTNHHVVDGAERIDVSLFGNERKRYRAIRVGSDPLTDSALIRLLDPPPNLQSATLGNSSLLEPGDWVVAIGDPFQFGHSVTVGVVSFPKRPFQIQEGRWQDLIQTDAAINLGSSGGPLFNVRGEVVGMNVAIVDSNGDASAGIGFALPIDTLKALLPQLRTGTVVRGELGVELHGGPILDDEAAVLRLPKTNGSIVMNVAIGSAADCAGLKAGDVIVEIGGAAVADTRDLIARTASMTPGTRVTVKTIRDGKEQTRTATIEAQPLDPVKEVTVDGADGADGLTLGEIAPPGRREMTGAAAVGALVVDVTPDSPADEAALAVGDIIQTINGHPVHTADEARRELGGIPSGLPIFLLVSRVGTEIFLEMRKN